MMTPNDVENHQFSNARFGGYSTDEVNRFLDEVAADYAALYRENATLKRKMKFLVVKLNEYQVSEAKAAEEKQKNDIVHQAYVNAREAADKMIAGARAERDAMLAEAKLEADKIRYDAQQSVAESEAQLEAARQNTLQFAEGMQVLVEHQQRLLEDKKQELNELLTREQAVFDSQLEFLRRLNQLRPAEEAPAAEEEAPPAPQQERDMTEIVDEDLMEQLRAVEEEAAADPSAAYEQDMSDVDAAAGDFVEEPTRVIEIE